MVTYRSRRAETHGVGSQLTGQQLGYGDSVGIDLPFGQDEADDPACHAGSPG